MDWEPYEPPINARLIHDLNDSECRSCDSNATLLARYLLHTNDQKSRGACGAHDGIVSGLHLDEGMRVSARARI